MTDLDQTEADAIAFAERYATSEKFREFFKEGMSLVERTADYLDGEGREASKTLPRAGAMLYASESMRLTTRLMQVSSWLLLQRAVNEGEMTLHQLIEEKKKVSLETLSPNFADPLYDKLPEGLISLIDASLALQRRVKRLDKHLYTDTIDTEEVQQNAVHATVSKLESVFGS